LSRGDAQLNGVVALVRCLCWFNPLAHLGAHLMRVDQELACDASVIARYPKSRAPYAQALLKAELAARPLPLGCYWPAKATHPLTERMAMLQRDPLPRDRRLAGAACVGALAAVASTVAWAARPPDVVATMVAARSVAALPSPAGEHGFAPVGDPSAAPARAVPAVAAAPDLQAPIAGATEEPSNAAGPSPEPDQDAAPAAMPSPAQPPEQAPRGLLLASLQPTLKSASLQRPPPSTADLPAWSQTPSAADMQAAYPPAAARVNYASSATLDCTVASDGGLTDCVVASERAPGFGAAALEVAPKFRLPTTSPSGVSIVGRTVRPRISWVNPATSTATLTIKDEGGPLGTVAFNCRVRAHGSLDNCVVVDARPRGRGAFGVTGEAALRFQAPAGAPEFSRIRVIVAVLPTVMPVTNPLTCSNNNCGGQQ
ncbi:MAG TPA: M56 family metallopeptidase, partial [Phenylobacterium sp.]